MNPVNANAARSGGVSISPRPPLVPFRPLFFLAATFAALGMFLWSAFLHLGWLPGTVLPAPWWHAHAMLFGFVGALISGFLLTAAANWTGLKTTTRPTLIGLCVLWLAARIAFVFGAPLALAFALDMAWLATLVVMVARVIILKRNRRNFFIIGLLSSYLALDAVFLGAALAHSELASRALVWTVDWITILMLVIGGRVIPPFSGNKIPQMAPVNHRWLAITVNVGAALALLIDILDAPPALRGALWVLLAIAAFIRLLGWHGWRGLREPMLWSLHLGYLWLAVGMGLRGLALLGVFGESWDNPALHNALHGITVGALGTLSLAMMTRVAQGHSGVEIRANPGLVMAFLLPSAAAILRLVGGPGMWPAAGTLWTLAYLIYLAAIGPLLVRGRGGPVLFGGK